jgi:formylglycine-generating enzyme required for sulfatase activity
MPPRRHDGAALLVAGYGVTGAPAIASSTDVERAALPEGVRRSIDASAVHTLGQIGEALLATGATWQIRRLAATAGERAVDRATIKRHVDELVAERARIEVLVVVGAIVDVGGQPALVTGPDAREYPEDSTLPLSWIRERLAASHAEQAVIVVSARGDGTPRAWLDMLATKRGQHLIAIELEPATRDASLPDALLAGLCGDALDPRTGTVTMASLSSYLAERAPSSVLQTCDASETVAQPPPLAGLWDVRRSQLSLRGTRPRVPRALSPDDDLTGTVLPGRFRIDTLVARGTFGTIYRARQLAVERDVALKVLHADIDPSSEDGRLFVHEIRSVGRIDHANVVRIYQADITHDGRLFFAMELLDGKDLATIASAGTVPRERALELVRQLLAGLGAAHDAGLVHADVKPANAIVIDKDGVERVVLVDFGLSRLRSPDRPAESAGGTPAYMAPEQMMEGRVDARSDLFSAALVFVHLWVGWRRPNAFTLAPPFDVIPDADLRAVLERALATDPAKRYASAAELSAALTGTATPTVEPSAAVRPFRHLEPLTEDDRGRLHGRQADLALLTEHALYRRGVIYSAPSGVGKTSLLRAGLVPRLEALGVRVVYVRCRGDSQVAIASAIDANATTIEEAITAHVQSGGGKLVLILDQLERALADANAAGLVRSALAVIPDADVSVVMGIREDHLARLVAKTQEIDAQLAIVRLPPLSPEGATDAIVAPLAESRLEIEPALLAALLDDLQRAAQAIGTAMGWGATPSVYPPHLQLACTVLYEALPTGESTLTLAHYKKLGGFDTIVGEHLERVLDTELADGRDVIARDLFLALVTSANERAIRSENELLAIASVRHAPREVRAVLETLRSRGLLVRVRDASGEPGWELVHDSLVPRVLAWLDRRDLDRRRAIELLRYHVRRSRADAPSLLGRAELRELAPYESAIAELDAEQRKRDPAPDAWTPSGLVAASRRALRRRVALIALLLAALVGVSVLALYIQHRESERRTREAFLRVRDVGRFTLSLELFDWDPKTLAPVPSSPTEALQWTLHSPSPDDSHEIGAPFSNDHLVRRTVRTDRTVRLEDVEAKSGPAFLVVTRGACAPSIVPIHELPGYAQRDQPVTISLRIPTCAASSIDMVRLAGAFLDGGAGEPGPTIGVNEIAPERTVTIPPFAIDRAEVTNAWFAAFAALAPATRIHPPIYPSSSELPSVNGKEMPVAGIDWYVARSFCRFLGKDLPTSQEWMRAMRGPITLATGEPNPHPRRNFPWGTSPPSSGVRIEGSAPRGPAPVGTVEIDRSIEGVYDLAGNVQEWTASASPDSPQNMQVRATRGGNWVDTPREELVTYVAFDNIRVVSLEYFGLGMRCVSR